MKNKENTGKEKKDTARKILAKDLLVQIRTTVPMSTKDFANGSTNFWYYTRLSTADKILESKSFYVSCLNDMNDKEEANLHEQKKKDVFSLCFCNSNSEKIPMWYLYSGITGEGASIGFTVGAMVDFLRSIKCVYDVDDDDKERPIPVEGNFEFFYGWVYYRKQCEKGKIFYKHHWYSVDDPDGFERNNYFIKSYPWEYECEFRIVFVNKSARQYKKIKVIIPDKVYPKLKIKTAPELPSEKLSQRYPEMKGFMQLHISTIMRSTLNISMGLLGRNKESIEEYVEGDILGKNELFKEKNLCRIIQKASHCQRVEEEAVLQKV